MLRKTTYWIDPDDNPLIIQEGNSVVIRVNDLIQGHSQEVYIASALFPVLRRAMDKAEGGAGTEPPQAGPRRIGDHN